MTFLRTASGLRNRNEFFGTDFTVYIEMDPDVDPAKAVDVAFWSSFFTNRFEGHTFSFSPLGGKPHVKNLAVEIVREDLKNVLCAMDADYDTIFSNIILDDRVFYTYGYGVENDLLGQLAIRMIVGSLVPGLNYIDDRSNEIWHYVRRTVALEWSCLRGDQIGVFVGRSLLNRNDPTNDIDHSNKQLPVRFRRGNIRKNLLLAKDYVAENVFANSTREPHHDVPAHHYFEIVYHTIIRFLTGISNVKISKDHFLSVCIATADNIMRGNYVDVIGKHYDLLSSRNLSSYKP